ncbi:MAG TPA: hypothetical protein VMV94_05125 [Phycisphaerae bacterium]|nr:hypothetical protein [Phycisphaerae bacterium]
MYQKLTLIAVLVMGCWQPAQGQSGDALDEALGLVGVRRDDLGWQPKGWWTKFPAQIPYKLRSFDSLFDHPLDAITYTRLLANAARVHLDPAVQNKLDDRKCSNIYHAAHILGVDPKYGAMRGYATNLPKEDTPLDKAIVNMYTAAGRTTQPFTFYMDLPYPQYEKELTEKVQVIPEKARPILGRLVTSISEAHHWAELAVRNVDGADLAVVARRYNVGHEEVDAYDYCPQFDSLAQTLDQASLWYAAEKCVEALEDARIGLAAVEELKNPPPFAFDWQSPWGWIRIRGGGDDQIDGTDALLIVDLGGNDHYTGGVAASTSDRLIGLCLDMAGNDRYESDVPAQGAGMCGIGILIDAAGDDEYKAEHYAQGVGQFGFGLLADLGGNDHYFVKFNGQGCGYFGIGLLFDCDGDDQYKLYADGQGLGGVAGVGVLADRKGDDTYEAVRDAKITGRPSYHSPKEDISVSNAQGCAMGRRGDGCDGHSWAGGLGALIDIEGDDKYTSGSWTMGTGYWFGTGILYDGSGNDEYRGVCYSQATGAHFCIGVLLDEGGNDKHLAEATANMCCAWGHDFTIALLVDIGGDDVYDVRQNGISYSINRSFTALIDIGGNDTYKSDASLRKPEENRPGFAKYDPRFEAGTAERPEPGFYFADATSMALFLDIGGKDTYWSGQKDNSQWLDEPGAPNYRVRNFSIGIDRPEGAVSFVPIPEKKPTQPPPKLLTTSQPAK